MTRKWRIIKRVISGLEIIWGLFVLGILINGAIYLWEFASRQTDIIPASQFALLLIKKFHNQFVLSIMTIYAGINLLYKNRIGWITSIAASILNIIGIITSWIFLKKSSQTIIEEVFVFAVTVLTFFAALILLQSKPFKDEYYKPSTSIKISIMVVILFLDSLLFKDF